MKKKEEIEEVENPVVKKTTTAERKPKAEKELADKKKSTITKETPVKEAAPKKSAEKPEKEEKTTGKAPKKEAVVEIKDLYKSYGDNHVLQGLTLTVYKGESLVVIGKSGTGKSVLIKCLIGLDIPDSGGINILGEDVLTLNERDLNKLRIRIGFLFQSGALYDSMTIEQNLAFPLTRHKEDLEDEEVKQRIDAMLQEVDLHEVNEKMPSELSGGMRKRVAVARTLILEPEVMLYDEPTTGLDTITSKGISELIIDMQKNKKMTSIIITHDMNCAKLTGDRIVILKDGKVFAEGSYDELENSKDEWIRSFFEN